MKEHIPYQNNIGHPHNFVVEYRILTAAEGGRKTLPFQGIRWDFWYPHDEHGENKLFMIWPEFLAENGGIITQ